MKLINIGFGNLVSAGRVVAVVSPDSAPVKLDHNFTATLLVYGCTYLTDVCLLHFSTSLFHALL